LRSICITFCSADRPLKSDYSVGVVLQPLLIYLYLTMKEFIRLAVVAYNFCFLCGWNSDRGFTCIVNGIEKTTLKNNKNKGISRMSIFAQLDDIPFLCTKDT